MTECRNSAELAATEGWEGAHVPFASFCRLVGHKEVFCMNLSAFVQHGAIFVLCMHHASVQLVNKEKGMEGARIALVLVHLIRRSRLYRSRAQKLLEFQRSGLQAVE